MRRHPYQRPASLSELKLTYICWNSGTPAVGCGGCTKLFGAFSVSGAALQRLCKSWWVTSCTCSLWCLLRYLFLPEYMTSSRPGTGTRLEFQDRYVMSSLSCMAFSSSHLVVRLRCRCTQSASVGTRALKATLCLEARWIHWIWKRSPSFERSGDFVKLRAPSGGSHFGAAAWVET